MAFVFVWYFGQRVSNIGDSMSPIIKNGDIVLVNRILYDASTPKRGDVIVFKPNGNEMLHSYIKRIIALPGETVKIEEGKIFVNGKELEEEYETSAIVDAVHLSEISSRTFSGHSSTIPLESPLRQAFLSPPLTSALTR